MRPTSFPSTSRTLAPSRSSTWTSTLFLLLRPATRNVLDDVFGDPQLPVERTGFFALNVELHFPADCFDPRPGNFHRLVTLGAPCLRQPLRDAAEKWTHAHPERRPAHENVRDAWLGILTHVHQ